MPADGVENALCLLPISVGQALSLPTSSSHESKIVIICGVCADIHGSFVGKVRDDLFAWLGSETEEEGGKADIISLTQF